MQGGPGLLGQLIVINTGNTAALCLKPPASDAKSSLRPSGPWGRQTRLQRNGRGSGFLSFCTYVSLTFCVLGLRKFSSLFTVSLLAAVNWEA